MCHVPLRILRRKLIPWMLLCFAGAVIVLFFSKCEAPEPDQTIECNMIKDDKSCFLNLSLHPPTTIVDDVHFVIGDHKRENSIWLFIAVISTVSHFSARQVIRRSWGSNSDLVRVMFFVGRPNTTEELIQLLTEQATHGDIVQINQDETYHNLVYKSIAVLKWVTNIKRVKFLLKIDDDVYLKRKNLLHFLKFFDTKSKFIMGYTRVGGEVDRFPSSKHYLSHRKYPYTTFPTYTIGASYVISGDLVKDLLAVVPTIPLLHIEDVFITGMCASQTEAVFYGTCGFASATVYSVWEVIWQRSYITIHGVSAHLQMFLFNFSPFLLLFS